MIEGEGASAQDVARALKLDKSAAWRRLSAARQEGFVINLEQRKGMPGKYRALPQKVDSVSILPDAARLAESFRNVHLAQPPKTRATVQP
jgi:transposase